MKKIKYILSVPVLMLAFTSCGTHDDFTESIFDTSIPVVDTNASTYDFDQWIYDNFTKPYNVEVQYKFNLPASDLNYQLAPAGYDKVQLVSYFLKYLFYEVYEKYAGTEFLKMYSPRIYHFIGSSGYNPTTGTEILGLASGGVKITLYNLNEMKAYKPGVVYSSDDIFALNQKYFHTIHHEFSHILHQTKSYPVTFGQITSKTYDPQYWQERDSVDTHQMGYVTHYASSGSYEDFVETLSCIITDTDYRWMMRIINACAPGWYSGDKEEVIKLINNLGINMNDAAAHWNNFKLYDEVEYDTETGSYKANGRVVLDNHRDNATTILNKEATAYIPKFKYNEKKSFTRFSDFLNWVPEVSGDDLTGINALLKKISIATTWHEERWGLNTYTLRKEVSIRQDNLNNYLKDNVKIFELQ